MSADDQFLCLRHIVQLLRDAEERGAGNRHYRRACFDILEAFELYRADTPQFEDSLLTSAAMRQLIHR